MVKTVKDQWNAHLYDQRHSFVSQYGTNLVEILNPQKHENILDLGCGTGDLARIIMDLGSLVLGVDKSANMVEQAKLKYEDIPFEVMDATELDFEEEFDAVFSNATLHWVKPPDKALRCIHRSLKQGGRFVAEFGGKGNVQAITDEIIRQIRAEGLQFADSQFPWFYPSVGEYTSLMEEAGFRVTFAQHYDRPTQLDGAQGLQNWIEMFGDQLFNGIHEVKKQNIIRRVEENLKDALFEDGHWFADYKRIRVVAVKE